MRGTRRLVLRQILFAVGKPHRPKDAKLIGEETGPRPPSGGTFTLSARVSIGPGKGPTFLRVAGAGGSPVGSFARLKVAGRKRRIVVALRPLWF